MTRATRVVLEAFLADPTRELSGLQVCVGAGVPAGSVHPVLARLEGQGWLVSRWEDVDPAEGRPPRRFYRLTGVGSTLASAATARTRRWSPSMRWRPVTGQP